MRIPGWIREMPRRLAAAEPSTATGWLAVAALRYLPWATVVRTAAGRLRLAALTVRALVLMLGM
jgi:hypothetical protein